MGGSSDEVEAALAEFDRGPGAGVLEVALLAADPG
jgi:hypothetical protein